LPSACLVGRTESIRPGFDPELRVGEDVDLVWRLVAARHRVRYDPSVSALHDSRSTLRGWAGRKFEFDRMAGGLPASDGGKHLRELVPAVRELWQGDYALDGEIWQFPTSTSVPKPVQQPTPPMWIAARDPDSHDFAVRSGCNVMVTPLMKGDEEVVDLKRKFDTAVASHPEVPRPDLMVLRHTHVHSPDEPDGWRPAAEAISRFYRTFDAWFANLTTPVNGFLEPSPESKFEGRPEFEPESLHRTAMIGTPDEVIERLRYYEDLGIDEFSFWCDNSLPHEEKRRSLELFIKDVLPAFR